jgi:hypothetical protein
MALRWYTQREERWMWDSRYGVWEKHSHDSVRRVLQYLNAAGVWTDVPEIVDIKEAGVVPGDDA